MGSLGTISAISSTGAPASDGLTPFSEIAGAGTTLPGGKSDGLLPLHGIPS